MTRLKDLPAISDAEEARIQAGIAEDPDNPELTRQEIGAMRPASEVLPPKLYAALTKRRAGQSQGDQALTEEQITIALDRTVLDYFRAGGPGWQSRINDTLKEAIGLKR